MTELVTVVRATLQSSFVIAVVQGALGGMVIFLLDIRAPVLWGSVWQGLTLASAGCS